MHDILKRRQRLYFVAAVQNCDLMSNEFNVDTICKDWKVAIRSVLRPVSTVVLSTLVF
jgi:Tfp pilus assembly ATPase PilU